MAILSVLWGLALLSLVAVSLQLTANVSYRLARNTMDLAAAHMTAEAAVHRAVLSLLDPRPDKRWPVDGRLQAFELGGIAVKIAIQDELGRIDLNHADAGLLVNLFGSAGLDPQAAARMADRVLDWRDTSGGKRPGGAAERDYGMAGYTYRPRNGPFQSVDELRLVMGMTADLFGRVEPALTVHSGRPLIDPSVAPLEALRALPGMTSERAAALIAERSSRTGQATATGFQPTLAGRAYTIRAEMMRSEQPLVERAVVRLTGDPNQPFWVLDWRNR